MSTQAAKSRDAFYVGLSAHSGAGELPCQDSDADTDAWFAEPGSKRCLDAQAKCRDCPLWWECQNYAIDYGIPNGVWGGVNERERELIWQHEGGKPRYFNDEMDAATLALLQERRDFESFDATHDDPYETEDLEPVA